MVYLISFITLLWPWTPFFSPVGVVYTWKTIATTTKVNTNSCDQAFKEIGIKGNKVVYRKTLNIFWFLCFISSLFPWSLLRILENNKNKCLQSFSIEMWKIVKVRTNWLWSKLSNRCGSNWNEGFREQISPLWVLVSRSLKNKICRLKGLVSKKVKIHRKQIQTPK